MGQLIDDEQLGIGNADLQNRTQRSYSVAESGPWHCFLGHQGSGNFNWGWGIEG
jgi:hypothetical protein